jgi:hypothetical protein
MKEPLNTSVDSDASARALDRLLDEFASRHKDQPLTDVERAWARDALAPAALTSRSR